MGKWHRNRPICCVLTVRSGPSSKRSFPWLFAQIFLTVTFPPNHASVVRDEPPDHRVAGSPLLAGLPPLLPGCIKPPPSPGTAVPTAPATLQRVSPRWLSQLTAVTHHGSKKSYGCRKLGIAGSSKTRCWLKQNFLSVVAKIAWRSQGRKNALHL